MTNEENELEKAEAKQAESKADRAAVDENERSTAKESKRAHRTSPKQDEDLKNAQEQLDAAATVFNTGGQEYQKVDPNVAVEAFGSNHAEFSQGVVVNADETAPGDPSRVPEEMAVNAEVYQPLVREHDPLGTTDGEEPRVIADDLLREIQRPIKPSALGPSRDDALVGEEDEDMDADHDSRIIVNDPRNDVPEEGGVRVVEVAGEQVAEVSKPEDV